MAPTSARAASVSSARATSIAASSSAPIITWASGPSGWRRDRARVHRRAERGLDQAEAVVGGDLAPALPAEHRRGVEQHDALDLGLEAGVEEHLGARRAAPPSGPTRPSAPAAIFSVSSLSTCS